MVLVCALGGFRWPIVTAARSSNGRFLSGSWLLRSCSLDGGGSLWKAARHSRWRCASPDGAQCLWIIAWWQAVRSRSRALDCSLWARLCPCLRWRHSPWLLSRATVRTPCPAQQKTNKPGPPTKNTHRDRAIATVQPVRQQIGAPSPNKTQQKSNRSKACDWRAMNFAERMNVADMDAEQTRPDPNCSVIAARRSGLRN
jgi:hypothetical protein